MPYRHPAVRIHKIVQAPKVLAAGHSLGLKQHGSHGLSLKLIVELAERSFPTSAAAPSTAESISNPPPMNWQNHHAYRAFEELLGCVVIDRRSYITVGKEPLDFASGFKEIQERFVDAFDASDASFDDKAELLVGIRKGTRSGHQTPSGPQSSANSP